MLKKKVLNFRLMPMMLLVAIVGILSISLFHFLVAIIGIVAFGIVVLVVGLVERYRKYLGRVVILFITYIVFVLVGGAVITKATTYVPPVKSAVVTATINSDSIMEGEELESGSKYSLVLTDGSYVDKGKTTKLGGKISVEVVLPKDKKFKVGDIIVIKADILPKTVKIAESVNIYNYMEGIRYRLDNSEYMDMLSAKPNFRESIKIKCREAMLKYVPSGEIIYSMVFGDKIAMDSEFVSSSRKTGIAHLFAVSGLHLGIVSGVVTYVVKKIKIHRVIELILVVMLTGAYAVIVGFGPSVTRALLMLVVYKTGRLLGLRYCGISSLAISGIIILLINPLTLYNMSFQMSAMAMIGILFFEKPLEERIRTRWKKLNKFIALNLSVNISIIPITLHYYGNVSLIFLIANLLIVPIITVIFPINIIVVIIAAVVPEASYVIVPIGYIFSFIEQITKIMGEIPFISIRLTLSIYSVIGYIIVMVVVSRYSMVRKLPKRVISVGVILIILTASLVTGMGRLDGSVKLERIITNTEYDVVMMDIQNKHYLMVNGKLNENTMYESMSYLKEKNIQSISGIVKSKIEDNEIEIIKKFKEKVEIEEIITHKESIQLSTILDIKVIYARVVGEYMISPITEEIIQLTGNGKVIQLIDNRKGRITSLTEGIDILYMVGDNKLITDKTTNYYVSDIGVENNIPQSVNSYFTFILKNDTIRVV